MKSRFLSNYSTIRKYNESAYKLVSFKYIRDSAPEEQKRAKRGEKNREKLNNNISRTRSAVYDLSASNPWEYFVTFTLDSKKYSRENLEAFRRDFSKKVTNFNAYHCTSIKYLLIPEYHKDGKCWHMHGLMMGITEDMLTPFTLDMHLPYRILDKLKEGGKVYDWKFYSEQFGFCDIEPIRNHEAVCKYITKYITKELAMSIKELNSHCYYASKGLNRSKIIKRGMLEKEFAPDYENEYIRVKTVRSEAEALSYFTPDITYETVYRLKGSTEREEELNYAIL